jgi:small subunit ribosomal protein S15
MPLTKKKQVKVAKTFKRHEKDSGSAEFQIALFTEKIKQLVEHLKTNPKDKHSRRGLLGMVSQRKKMMKYLKTTNEEVYTKVIKKLNLKG